MRSLTLVSGKDGMVEALEGVMNNVPSGTQIFSMIPLSKSGLYTGSVLLGGWNGKENSLYIVTVGQASEQFNQGFIISSDDQSNILECYSEMMRIQRSLIRSQKKFTKNSNFTCGIQKLSPLS